MTTAQIAAVIRQWFERAGQVNGPVLPDGWFGRPYDNQYSLEALNESDDAIVLRLSQEAVLRLTRPRRAFVERAELVVDGYDDATFEWKDAGGVACHTKNFTSEQVRFVPPIGPNIIV
jgi:hypothetical protein